MFKEARKGFSLHARAQSTPRCTRQLNRIKISSPEVKCCVKSREPEIKPAGDICF